MYRATSRAWIHYIRALAPCAALALAASGCVSAMSARNYVPQNPPYVDQAYYQCLQASQQGYARAGYGTYANAYSYASSGGASAGQETNVGMLKSCMGAKGYRKRDATSTENWVGLATAPLWVPLCLVAATGGVNCLADE
jgi:hypothetical protein